MNCEQVLGLDPKRIVGVCLECNSIFDIDAIIEGDTESYVDDAWGCCETFYDTEWLSPCCRTTEWEETFLGENRQNIGGGFYE